MKQEKSVELYLSNSVYTEELKVLRSILQSTELEECVKWGMPCYTLKGKNVVGIGAFKSYFGLWFHQGALLKDDHNVLINAQEGKTKALRQWRMAAMSDIKKTTIKRYLKEAITLAKEGKAIPVGLGKRLVIPSALKAALSKNKKAGAAFAHLTPGKKRAFADYIAEAKRADTKDRRIEKILPMITSGVGLNDKYKNC